MRQLEGFYTPAEVMEIFGWKRAQLSATARREKWHRVKVGPVYLYNQMDVDLFNLARHRTELLKKAGHTFKGNGLVRDDYWDYDCPICGDMAVICPNDVNLLCVNGHKGELCNV